MTKQQVNVRLPEITRQQIDELARITGLTVTQIIIMAIDHLHKEQTHDSQ